MPSAGQEQTTEARLTRRALFLEYATIAWNVGEAVLTITLGSIAGSLALIGFGTVSIVEVFASSVVVWHVRSGDDGDHGEGHDRAEQGVQERGLTDRQVHEREQRPGDHQPVVDGRAAEDPPHQQPRQSGEPEEHGIGR